MAEKKKSWFGRLFGGKKKDEPLQVDVVETASETVSPEMIEDTPSQITQVDASPLEATTDSSTQIPEEIDEKTGVKETIKHVSETVIDAVIEEAHEAFTPQKNDQKADKTEEVIQPQHSFINDIAEDAKAEIEAAHLDQSPITLDSDAEETHESVIQPTDHIEEIKTEEIINPQHHLIDDIAKEAIAEVKTADTEEETPQIAVTEASTKAIEDTSALAETMPASNEASTEVIAQDTALKTTENFSEEIIEETTAAKEPAIIEAPEAEETITEVVETQEKPQKKTGFFARLTSKLSKTRTNLTEGIADLFLGKKEINEEILEELETRLLMADVGINVTDQMLTNIRDSVSRKSLSNVDELFAALKVQMKDILEPVSQPLVIDTTHKPYVILMIGVNGVGKTTTIGKLAKKFQAEGKSVMLAAGDTFRAAAVEQLEIWGERNKIPVISQKEGADPASVIFDAMESAKSRKVDILIADTAGRLHTDSGLMQELAKINRVIKRHDETAPHEVMLVVDASTGQNALNQARQFNTTVPLSGITFTKLDGTAKGGIIFAIAEELKIPIRFIGVGESIDDLRPFDSTEFVDALISTEKTA